MSDTLPGIPTQYTLDISISGQPGTTEPVPGSWLYDAGSVATITATPDVDDRFKGWFDYPWEPDTEPFSTDNPLNIVMDADRSIVARFEQIVMGSLTLSVLGNGTTDPAPGIPHEYEHGEIVSVLAIPDPGYKFHKWWYSSGREIRVGARANPTNVEIFLATARTAVFTSTAEQVYRFYPNAPGDRCEVPNEVGLPCPDHWANVDEKTPNGLIDYIWRKQEGDWSWDLYNTDADNQNRGVLQRVEVQLICEGDVDISLIGAVIKSGIGLGEPFLEDDNLNQRKFLSGMPGWTSVTMEWWFNPATGGPFTWDELSKLQMGIRMHTSKRWYPGIEPEYEELVEARCTAVYGRAYFIPVEPPPQRTLDISATAGGTTSPAPSTYTFDADTMVVVTAIPHSGYQFVEWQENGVPISTDNPINLLMDTDRSITAVFEEVVPTHTLTILTVGQGTTNPAPGSWEYNTGASIRVTAIPDAGWAFDHWEGDVSGTENPVSFIITADMIITAVFSEIVVPPEEFALTISALEGGITDPAPGSYTYIEGTLVTVTAIPSSGWKFDHWEGDLIGINPEITVEMLQNLSIVAVFAKMPIGFKLEDWLPQEPTQGPPLPEFLKIFWPWYKPPGEGQ